MAWCIMTTWQDIIQRYHIRHSDKIAKTTSPLQDHFHVTCIDYIKIYDNGKFSYLTNRPECAEYYATEQLFRADPYFRHPNTQRTGLFLMENVDSVEFQKNNQKISEQFNIHFPLIYAEKPGNLIELFCFSGDQPRALQTLYLQYPELLKIFIGHFKKELSDLLRQMEEESFSLIDLQGDLFYEHLPRSPDIQTESLHDYLISLGKASAIQKASSLSRRERDCLRLLIHGHSAKDSAMELHLSPRTVESYLENIKNKLNCHSKRELLSTAAELAGLGLLDKSPPE